MTPRPAPTSISDHPLYTGFCRRAAEDDACFASFREAAVYTAVVTSALHYHGQDYFALLQQRNFDLSFFDAIREHDRIGGPALVDFGPAGAVAPQTMRYVKTLSDLEQLYGSLEGKSIIEIGGGFGGLCAVLAKRSRFARYTLVDLPEVLMLARRYLDQLGIDNVHYAQLNELPFAARYDLAISCYGLSEIARPVQLAYAQRVLLNAAAGYLLWNNEAMKQHKNRQLEFFGSEMLYWDAVLEILPAARVLEASWLPPEDHVQASRLIVWGMTGDGSAA